jgi:hypothetical protein
MSTSIEVPLHELSNYRIALDRFHGKWQDSKDGGKALWNKVLSNALRLAEAVDRAERKAPEDGTADLPIPL